MDEVTLRNEWNIRSKRERYKLRTLKKEMVLKKQKPDQSSPL